jgi:transposase
LRKLTLGSAQVLRALIHTAVRTSSEQRFLHRLHCVLLVGEGRSCYEVARWFGEDPRTIERWVHALERRGVEGLHEHHAGGRPAKLTAQQAQRLALDLQNPPPLSGYPKRQWSGKLLTQHLGDRYGIKLSARQCQRMLLRMARAGPTRLACIGLILAATVLSGL